VLFVQQVWDGVKYAWSDYVKALVGSILIVVPVVNVFVLGFLLAVFQNVRKGMELPSWGEWSRLLKLGVFCFGVLLAYVLGLLLVSLLASGLAYYGQLFFLLLIVSVIVLMAVMGLIVFLLYALPAALVRVASSEKFIDGFCFAEIFSAACTWQYGRVMLQWLVLFVVFCVFFVVGRLVGVGYWLISGLVGTGVLLWTVSVAAVYVLALAYGVRKNNSRR